MTERYTGWEWNDARHGQRRGAEIHADLNKRSISYPSSSFTAINHPQQNAPQHLSHSSATAHGRHGQNRHPQLLAQYLGLGDDHANDSHLNQLATVNTTPPSSPSEQNIPKRKRAGERIAKEIKQTAKRAKSIPYETREAPDNRQHKDPARKSNVARRRAFATSKKPNNVSQSGNEAAIKSFTAQPAPDLSLSETTVSKLNAWKYDCHQTFVPMLSTPSRDGIVSLVAPLTSMDLIQKSRDAVLDGNEPVIPQPSVKHYTAPHLRQRRAPSTAHPLEAIPEEPLRADSSRPHISGASRHSRIEHATEREASSPCTTPVFHASPSLISTSTESFPPAQRRHKIIDREIAPPVRMTSDEVGAFLELDEDDLLELEGDLAGSSSIHSRHGIGKRSQPEPEASEHLPTPHASDEDPALDDTIFDALDDDDEWLQLPDIAPRVIELISSDPAQQSNDAALTFDNVHSSSAPDASTKTATVNAMNKTPSPLDEELEDAEAIAPFARPEYLKPIQDRSPLLNITNSLVLKTCFRIGEAVNIGARYARQSPTFTSEGILIELYARVLSSHRPTCHAGARQDFVFADLWSEKGPQLLGEWTCWKGSEVFEADAKKLLTDVNAGEAQKMCRIVGKMKRENKEWKFIVLSAWECGWDDVECARDIICHE